VTKKNCTSDIMAVVDFKKPASAGFFIVCLVCVVMLLMLFALRIGSVCRGWPGSHSLSLLRQRK